MIIMGVLCILFAILFGFLAKQALTKEDFWEQYRIKSGKTKEQMKVYLKNYAILFIVFAIFFCGMGIFFCSTGIKEGELSSGKKSTGNTCTICGKPATHEYQGSGYCDEHYNDAVEWSINNAAGKEN